MRRSDLPPTSCLYQGLVWHRRNSPKNNEFTYQVYLHYLDLDELDQVFNSQPAAGAKSRWWQKYWPLTQFRPRDYFDGKSDDLSSAVRSWIEGRGYPRPAGPIKMLANIRMFGYIINPITCYYVFADDGKTLEYVIAEVTNTPWEERIQYLLPVTDESGDLETRFDKNMHVSPFNPMDMQYRWRSNSPGDTLFVGIDNWRNGEEVFNASLRLSRIPLTVRNKRRLVVTYPWMTAKVAIAIYWQALKLFVKRVPLYGHPKSVVRNG